MGRIVGRTEARLTAVYGAQDVRTHLPYVSSRRLVGLEDRLWEGVFMDDERIVGLTESTIHILHLQP